MAHADVRDSHLLLGNAVLSDDLLTATVRAVVADPHAEIASWRVERIDYPAGSPGTGALLRVMGAATTGGGRAVDWSVFVKVLRSPAMWPFLHLIPPSARADFLAHFPWRLEAAAYESGVEALLPPSLRLARLYRLVDIDEHHTALWMEDVLPCAARWDVPRFRRAAYALGELAARRRPGVAPPLRAVVLDAPPGIALRYYVQSRVGYGSVPALTDPLTWEHPLLASAVAACGDTALRADFLALAERIPELLAGVESLPQTYAHGDASPQNLLVSADDPDRFVVIDWGFDTPLAIGFDLGQLLVGLAHAGELDPADLPVVHAAILPAYIAGLRAEGMQVDEEQVRYGYVASMVLRSAFTALPLEELGDPSQDPADAAVRTRWCARVRLTRYLIDLAATLR